MSTSKFANPLRITEEKKRGYGCGHDDEKKKKTECPHRAAPRLRLLPAGALLHQFQIKCPQELIRIGFRGVLLAIQHQSED